MARMRTIIAMKAGMGAAMDDFLWRAILGVALLGAGLGLLIGIAPIAGVAAVAVAAGLIMSRTNNH